MQTIEMRVGERRVVNRSGGRVTSYRTDRFFVFYVSATGHEGGLKECPLLRQRFMKPIANDDNGGWISEYIYDAEDLVILKLVHLGSEHARPKTNETLYVQLDAEGPKYKVAAPVEDGVGHLIFRGTIDWDLSEVTPEAAAAIFDVTLISSPKKKGKSVKGRNILFRKGVK